MDINLTFFGEMLTFAVLVFLTMRYIWPQVAKAMQERQQKIASGLAAAERAQHSLDIAQQNALEKLRDATQKANVIIANAQRQTIDIIDSGRNAARKEGARILKRDRFTIEKEKLMLEQELKRYATDLGIAAADKILQKKVDDKFDRRLIEQFIAEIAK